VVSDIDTVETDVTISVTKDVATVKLDTATVVNMVVLSDVCWTVMKGDPVPVVVTYSVVKLYPACVGLVVDRIMNGVVNCKDVALTLITSDVELLVVELSPTCVVNEVLSSVVCCVKIIEVDSVWMVACWVEGDEK
jgi:hypothetical protein